MAVVGKPPAGACPRCGESIGRFRWVRPVYGGAAVTTSTYSRSRKVRRGDSAGSRGQRQRRWGCMVETAASERFGLQ